MILRNIRDMIRATLKMKRSNMNNIYELNEPQKAYWGGKWTEQKLDTFEKYVNAYLAIMNKRRDDNNWKLIYFDGFAGSGTREFEDYEKDETVFASLNIDEKDLEGYKGAAQRVLSIEKRGFDYYYFIDSDKKANDNLKNKLENLDISKDKKMVFRVGDANDEIKKLSNLIRNDSNFKVLILLDPFGMQITWNSIEQFAGLKGIDLWLLIPTGVIVNRLIDKKKKLLYKDKLCSFLGMSDKEIQENFYTTKEENTLFGTELMTEKIKEPIEKIAQVYIEKLEKLFNYVTDKPLVMFNRKNVPIYHFVFASHNKTAMKIAKDIIGRTQK
jgi:three-Cys-motif partner protein